MAHSLIPRDESSSGLPRRFRRAYRGLLNETDAQEAMVSMIAAVQTRRLRAMGCTGRTALSEIARTSQAEQTLGTLVPLAVTKLEGVSNLVAVGLAQIVQDTIERLSS